MGTNEECYLKKWGNPENVSKLLWSSEFRKFTLNMAPPRQNLHRRTFVQREDLIKNQFGSKKGSIGNIYKSCSNLDTFNAETSSVFSLKDSFHSFYEAERKSTFKQNLININRKISKYSDFGTSFTFLILIVIIQSIEI